MSGTSWERIGPVAEFGQLSAIYQALCGHLLWFWLPTPEGGVKARTKLMGAPEHLFAFDHDFKRYIEQNPNTSSIFSRRVKNQGARIVWVLDTRTKEYIGRIEDGIVYVRKTT